ncbi:PPC domain-containing protein [Microbulbifer sp. OS29]|uniref:PPC domain-containing protein n=1 Tax=Microbulbifer okhotskensis TaxID=2926617 RepID=A0A9X2ETS9_9GAMM|nr:PPC domain-containing protein [Microbulbifer okhotskensis]MCO1335708.1 PPC domain-containing protein [Microbulbifer okhotskensis]
MLSPVECSFEGVDLTTTVFLDEEQGKEIINNQPVSGLSANTGEALYYSMIVPESAVDLNFEMGGGGGDVNLYVRFGDKPTEPVYDYRPFLGGNEETVSIVNSRMGVWHVMLMGYTDFEQVSLMESFGGLSSESLNPDETVEDLGGKVGEQRNFRVQVPEGAAALSITTGSSFISSAGDTGLYVNFGEPVSSLHAEYTSKNWSSNETIDVSEPQAGIWYVTVHGYSDFERVW